MALLAAILGIAAGLACAVAGYNLGRQKERQRISRAADDVAWFDGVFEMWRAHYKVRGVIDDYRSQHAETTGAKRRAYEAAQAEIYREAMLK